MFSVIVNEPDWTIGGRPVALTLFEGADYEDAACFFYRYVNRGRYVVRLLEDGKEINKKETGGKAPIYIRLRRIWSLWFS
jgi:hypothetical protein